MYLLLRGNIGYDAVPILVCRDRGVRSGPPGIAGRELKLTFT